ncbi:hypothetical protein AB0K05_12390 [Nonomuraea sp. NPDC049486]|uniref:hypothetical protein n=1 Tax=Nonomuraea sp. NPDC049486 TaxID=3155773 RepID=UPI003416BB40
MKAWPRARVRGLLIFAIVVGTLLGAGAGSFLLWGSGDDSAVPLMRDPLPKPSRWAGPPASCGVSPETIRELVPGAEPGEQRVRETARFFLCSWSTPSSLYGKRRVTLRVSLSEEQSSDKKPSVSDAMGFFETMQNNHASQWRDVVGLADEAVVGGGTVLFRTEAVIAEVEYEVRLWDQELKLIDDEHVLTDGALKVAAGVARALGLEVGKLSVVTAANQSTGDLLSAPEDICATVSEDVLVSTGVTPAASMPLTRFAYVEGAAGGSCTWYDTDYTRSVHVAVSAVPDGASATAERKAARHYLMEYHRAREGAMILDEHRGSLRFHALRGLGDEAFACAYVDGRRSDRSKVEAYGVVWFRVHNLLVRVEHRAPTGELTEESALTAAYKIAKDLAGSLETA